MRYTLIPLAAVFMFAGCAATPKFLEVNPHPIVKGSGGRVTQYGGVDFWQGGTPTRKYEVLGYVGDYWLGPSFDDYDFKRLAPLVHSAGGDAGIEIRGDGPAPGLVRQKDEVGDNILRLQVIKYL